MLMKRVEEKTARYLKMGTKTAEDIDRAGVITVREQIKHTKHWTSIALLTFKNGTRVA